MADVRELLMRWEKSSGCDTLDTLYKHMINPLPEGIAVCLGKEEKKTIPEQISVFYLMQNRHKSWGGVIPGKVIEKQKRN